MEREGRRREEGRKKEIGRREREEVRGKRGRGGRREEGRNRDKHQEHVFVSGLWASNSGYQTFTPSGFTH